MIKKTEAQAFLQTNLKRLMAKQGIGTRSLAKESENDPMAISRILNQGRIPETDKILRIAKALSVTVEELFKPTKAGKEKLLEFSKN